MRRTIIWTATGMLGLMAGAGAVSAAYCPHPACDFSAYYYRSPGGIGPPRYPSAYVGKAAPTAVPHRQSCGKGRSWNGERCVVPR